MPNEKEIYQSHAAQYERLIQREDYLGNLLPEIEKRVLLDGLAVVELGAGTGRLTRLLAPRARSINAFDASAHMLKQAKSSLQAMELTNWGTAVADHRHLPTPDSSADLVIAGWSFCYLAVWGKDRWKPALLDGYTEIQRVLRPNGTVILLETLGTGVEKPHPPEHLKEYFAWLVEAGFQSDWMRTDFQFESLNEAIQLSTFFFGEEMGERARQNNWTILPECTGIWWRKNG